MVNDILLIDNPVQWLILAFACFCVETVHKFTRGTSKAAVVEGEHHASREEPLHASTPGTRRNDQIKPKPATF